ncbi:MAG: hypothetical protein KGJ09_08305 [Candidatus Omnitrophica bacterium]|nr:hypothetical protein [Candidatus Omnitrophota bacterium]MDE2010062.1 hypothetical protein [Candidatus Omnitrophota bacterium]MDE2214703.1 hypothetical protein [Candidatus Omnitrophota bacterium]
MKLTRTDLIILKLAGPGRPKDRCCICGRKVYSKHSIYCLRCFHFCRRMNQRGLHAGAVKAIWEWVRKHGYVCYYTGWALDLTNPKSPYYFEFDHFIPGDNRKIVLTCAVINEMKSVLAFKEWQNLVNQLSRHWRTGAKMKKISFKFWPSRGPHEK